MHSYITYLVSLPLNLVGICKQVLLTLVSVDLRLFFHECSELNIYFIN